MSECDYSYSKNRTIDGLVWETWSIKGEERKRWDMDRVYNHENRIAVIRRPSTKKWYVGGCRVEAPPAPDVGPYASFKAAMVVATTMVKLNQIPFEPGK